MSTFSIMGRHWTVAAAIGQPEIRAGASHR